MAAATLRIMPTCSRGGQTSIELHYSTSHHIASHYNTLHYITLLSLHYTTLHHTTVYYTILHYTHYTRLYYNTIHYITLRHLLAPPRPRVERLALCAAVGLQVAKQRPRAGANLSHAKPARPRLFVSAGGEGMSGVLG